MTQNETTLSAQPAHDSTRSSAVVKPVAVIMLAQALAKTFLLLREMLVSARFGASMLTDAFNVGLYISSYVPMILRPLVEDAFIPVYVRHLAHDREKAQGLW
jgi:putative peptidoglycan lipid II flippase